eukprot:1145394-Pelagomonas_calceolata.AAC.3
MVSCLAWIRQPCLAASSSPTETRFIAAKPSCAQVPLRGGHSSHDRVNTILITLSRSSGQHAASMPPYLNAPACRRMCAPIACWSAPCSAASQTAPCCAPAERPCLTQHCAAVPLCARGKQGPAWGQAWGFADFRSWRECKSSPVIWNPVSSFLSTPRTLFLWSVCASIAYSPA